MEKNLVDVIKSRIKFWWVSLLVGFLALVVGIWSIFAPLTTIGMLTIFFVASLLVSGIFDISFAVANRKILNGWGWTLTLGIINVIFSIVLMSRPIESMLVLIMLSGFWVMFTSIVCISGSVELKQQGFKDWGWLLAFGILGVVLSIFMVVNPVFTASMLVAFFAATMVLYGLVRIFYAFKLRKINQYLKKGKEKY